MGIISCMLKWKKKNFLVKPTDKLTWWIGCMQKELSAASLLLQEKTEHTSQQNWWTNNHVFAKAEETSNSARQHAWGQQRSVRVFSSVPKDDHCWISCVLHLHNWTHLYFCSTFFAQCTFNFNFGIWEESSPWTYCEKEWHLHNKALLFSWRSNYSPSCCSWPLKKNPSCMLERKRKKKGQPKISRDERIKLHACS